MKILLVDRDSHSLEILQNITQIQSNLTFDVAKSSVQAHELLFTNEYEFIFIDFDIEGGIELIESLHASSPTQKIVTISTSFKCSSALGCEHCNENYQKIRILKPIHVLEVMHILNTFETTKCKQYCTSDSNMLHNRIQKDLLHCSYYSYDAQNKKILSNQKYSAHQIKELLFLTSKLDSYNIPYSTDEDFHISLNIP